MINWEMIARDQGFKSEKQMWTSLLVALRNSDAIADHLGVSRGAVQRRRALLQMHKSGHRSKVYRKGGKRALLDKVPTSIWAQTLEEVQEYIQREMDIYISISYLSKYRRVYRKG